MKHGRYSRRNARESSEKKMAQIALIDAQIRSFGFLTPIVIDDRSIIVSGSSRRAAAQKLVAKRKTYFP